MTLCITYSLDSYRATAVSDSLLTTTMTEKASFLPSDEKIVHQNPYGVKVQIISQPDSLYSERFDILCSIAGNVSLGLQSILYIDGFLKGTSCLWYDHIKLIVEDKLFQFWKTARDQHINICFAMNDHKGRIRLFELLADNTQFSFYEVMPESEILISVIGDDCKEAKKEILTRVNTYSYKMKLEEAIHFASIEVLKEAIDSPHAIFVGGNIQGALLNHHHAEYCLVRNGNINFRSAQLEHFEELSYPILDLLDEKFTITGETKRYQW